MTAAEILFLPITDIAEAVRTGTLSPLTIAEAVIAGIEAKNPALNAIVRFDPDAVRAEARALAARADRLSSAPLFGVPFTVKDTIWVKDFTVTQGSRLFADFVAPRDAVAVERLRQAGALFVGFTNCSEFACKGVTTNRLYGPTRNPWDLSLTPGGSSGGAASAVSAGLCAFALATDGGGSTRRPAAHTGIVGIKPTGGRIPHPIGFAEPAFGVSVIGIMAKSVEDSALVLDVLSGPDPRDPLSSFPFHPTATAPALPLGAAGVRIAYSPRLGLDVAVDADVAASVAQAARRLGDLGAIVEEADVAWPEESSEDAMMPLQLAGLAALFGDQWKRDPDQFDPDIAGQIESGLAQPATAFANALFLREALVRSLAEFQERFDLLLTPTTPCPAWNIDRLGPETIGGRPAGPRGHAVFTPLFNHTLVPAVSVPCGRTAAGLPIGAQLVGRRYEDGRMLAAAAALEAVGGRFSPPAT